MDYRHFIARLSDIGSLGSLNATEEADTIHISHPGELGELKEVGTWGRLREYCRRKDLTPREIFQKFDRDQNGSIDGTEFSDMLVQLGILTAEEMAIFVDSEDGTSSSSAERDSYRAEWETSMDYRHFILKLSAIQKGVGDLESSVRRHAGTISSVLH